ncbi:MAG: FeoB-associated Cys-rich membrane protein [Treponema sp.]|nr:FeoB-associated Cys-rich membrane protein [Treponema sp.]
MGTIIVGSILAAAVVAVITSLVKNKIRGKTNCGCGCSECPHCGRRAP